MSSKHELKIIDLLARQISVIVQYYIDSPDVYRAAMESALLKHLPDGTRGLAVALVEIGEKHPPRKELK